MIRGNPVKQRLADGDTVFGTMMFEFLGPGLPQIAVNAGADFLFYDMEHSGFSMEQIKQQCALARGLDLTPMVRPAGKDYQFAARLLDIGAMGLMFQMVESAEEARRLVAHTRYPPHGVRGALFGGPHDDYLSEDIAAAVAEANERTLITVLIETERGLANVDEILAVDGIDAAQMGHLDLSISMGIPGDVGHPRMQAAIDTIAETAARHGKAAGMLVGDPDQGASFLDRGFRMISYSLDIALFQNALKGGIDALQQHLRRD